MKTVLQNQHCAEITNFAFGGKVDFLSIRDWLLKEFLLDSNRGYFVNYINELNKIINGRNYHVV